MLLQSHKGWHRYRYEMQAETVWKERGVEQDWSNAKGENLSTHRHVFPFLPILCHFQRLQRSQESLALGYGVSHLVHATGCDSCAGKVEVTEASSQALQGTHQVHHTWNHKWKKNSTDVMNTLTSEDRHISLLTYNNKKRKRRRRRRRSSDSLLMA